MLFIPVCCLLVYAIYPSMVLCEWIICKRFVTSYFEHTESLLGCSYCMVQWCQASVTLSTSEAWLKRSLRQCTLTQGLTYSLELNESQFHLPMLVSSVYGPAMIMRSALNCCCCTVFSISDRPLMIGLKQLKYNF